MVQEKLMQDRLYSDVRVEKLLDLVSFLQRHSDLCFWDIKEKQVTADVRFRASRLFSLTENSGMLNSQAFLSEAKGKSLSIRQMIYSKSGYLQVVDMDDVNFSPCGEIGDSQSHHYSSNQAMCENIVIG